MSRLMIQLHGVACYRDTVERCYSTLDLEDPVDGAIFPMTEFLEKAQPEIGDVLKV